MLAETVLCYSDYYLTIRGDQLIFFSVEMKNNNNNREMIRFLGIRYPSAFTGENAFTCTARTIDMHLVRGYERDR